MARKAELSVEEREYIVNLYRSGKTIKQIMAEAGRSFYVNRQILCEAGVELRKKDATSEQIAEAVRLFRSGLPLHEATRLAGCDPRRISRELKRQGLSVLKGRPGWLTEEDKRRKKVEANRILKQEMLAAYGHACTCCRETRWEFLTIDHVGGKGHEHRRAIGSAGGMDFYRRLRRAGWPRDGLQVLCSNCNLGKAFGKTGGICPHHAQRQIVPEETDRRTLSRARPDRRCPRCGEKPVAPSRGYCRQCEGEYMREYQAVRSLKKSSLREPMTFFRECRVCKLHKVLSKDFYKNHHICKRCYGECTKVYRAARPGCGKIAQLRHLERLREEVYSSYGGRCECCAEANWGFLSIDHVEGDGSSERKQGLRGRQLWAHLKRLNFPRDRYRLLCYNCNTALGRLGYCPHQA